MSAATVQPRLVSSVRLPTRTVPVLIQAFEDPEAMVREHATIALSKMGSTAVPALIKATESDRAAEGTAHDPNPKGVAQYAMVALATMGPEAAFVLMETALENEQDKFSIYVLRREASAATPLLAQLLRGTDEKLKLAAASVLSSMGREAAGAVPALAGSLVDQSADVRQASAKALGAIGPDAAAAVPALRKALEDGISAVRSAGAEALGGIGAASAPAASGLSQLLQDPDSGVRVAALQALRRIGPAAQSAIPAISAMLESPDTSLRDEAAMALGQVCKGIPACLPVLRKALNDPESEVYISAIRALASIGSAGLPSLSEIVLQGDGTRAIYALEALARIHGEAAGALPALIQALFGADIDRRIFAAAVVEKIGPAAKDAVPALIHALEDPNDGHHTSYIDALAEIGQDASSAIPAIVRSFRAQDSEERDHAAEALIKIGPAAVPAIIDFLKSADKKFWLPPLSALEELGDSTAAGISVMAPVLTDGDEDLRRSVWLALAAAGPAAAGSVTNTLKDPRSAVRVEAANLLSHIATKYQVAEPDLLPLADDADAQVRAAAVRGMPQLGKVGWPALSRALIDTDVRVREAALACWPDSGLEDAVRQALRDSHSRVRSAGMSALEKSGIPPERRVAVLLLALQNSDADIRGLAAKQLSKLRPIPLEASAKLRAALFDSDPYVRRIVADALLSADIDPGEDGPALAKELVDESISTTVGDTMNEIISALERRRPKQAPPRRSASPVESYAELPQLPWPLARASAWIALDKAFLGTATSRLKDVEAVLAEALAKTGFSEPGVFAAPSGFALVTQVERIHDDGSSFQGSDRWSSRKLPLSAFSLREYLTNLFFDRPGQFRLIVFVITTDQIFQSDVALNEEDARDLALKGARILPESIGELPMEGRECYALVYHFERTVGGGVSLLRPSPFSAAMHLQKANIESQFVR